MQDAHALEMVAKTPAPVVAGKPVQNEQSVDLVWWEGGQPITLSIVLAKGMDEAHSTIMAMVYTWLKRLEEHGPVIFKAWQDGKLALLNEQQAIYLLGKKRKTNFRARLIKAFGNFKWQNQQATLATTRLATKQTEATSVLNALISPKPKQDKPTRAEKDRLDAFNLRSFDLPPVGKLQSVTADTTSPVLGASLKFPPICSHRKAPKPPSLLRSIGVN